MSFDEHDADVAAVMAAYRKEQLTAHLIGPVLSTVMHVVGFVLMLVLLVFPAKKEKSAAEVTQIIEVEADPIPPKMPDEVVDAETAEDVTPVVTTIAQPDTDTDDSSVEDVSDDTAETADELPDQAVAVEKMFNSPVAMKMLGGRTKAGRAAASSKFGGDRVTLNSAMKALLWLKKNQNPNGSWGKGKVTGNTSLALLFFLAHGETPSSKVFGSTVEKGLKWLIKYANIPANLRNDPGHGYDKAMVTYALAEASSLIQIPALKEAMEKCVASCISIQTARGGYKAKSYHEDTSIQGWYMQALKASYMAGSKHPKLKESLKKSLKYMKGQAFSLNKGKNSAPNSFFYNIPGRNGFSGVKDPSLALRAVGSLALTLLGEGKSKEARGSSDYIVNKDVKRVKWGEKDINAPLYTWYYQTQVAFFKKGAAWNRWNRVFKKELTKNQFKDGHWESFGPMEKAGSHGMQLIDSQVYSTALCGLMLTVYYRYLPNVHVDLSKDTHHKKASKEEEAADDEDAGFVIE